MHDVQLNHYELSPVTNKLTSQTFSAFYQHIEDYISHQYILSYTKITSQIWFDIDTEMENNTSNSNYAS